MARGATWLLVRGEVRRRWLAYLAVVLVLGFGGGAAVGAAIAAHRTDRAYEEYVARAEVSRLVVNPSVATRAVDEVIRRLPGVRALHSEALFLASTALTGPVRYGDAMSSEEGAWLQVRGSPDGRYVDVDRPIVTDGRFATGTREVFVSDDYRPTLEENLGRSLHVGDTLDVGFWWGFIDEAELPPDEMVEPIGVEHLRVAGFGHLPDEVLPDELYPRQRLIVSADVARRYDCLGELRSDMTPDEALLSATPSDCSRSYRYYSLDLGPDASPDAIREAFNTAAVELDKEIPEALGDDVGYYFVTQDRTDLDHAVQQTTRPTVVSLVVLALLAGLATVTIAALGISRVVLRTTTEQSVLLALGMTARRRALIAALVPFTAGFVGVLLALLVGYLASPLAPVGSVRSVLPKPGFSFPIVAVAPAAAMFLVFVLVVGLAARRAARPGAHQAGSPRAGRLSEFAARAGARPAAVEGIRAGLRARVGTWATLAGCAVAVTTIAAAVVFGVNLGTAVSEPREYGWPWDVAVITGGGYGDTRAQVVRDRLDGDPDVARYGFFTFDPASRLGEDVVPALYGFPNARRSDFPVVRGRTPARPGEALVGTLTAADLGLDVGDRVEVQSTLFDVGSVEVVGIGVLPSLGPFVADRTGPGSGAMVLLPDDPASEFNPAALTAITLRDGVDANAFLDELQPQLQSWDALDAVPLAQAAPVRPPEIVDADGLRAGPLALAALLVAALVTGLTLAIAQSVRDRRREFAVLRALGFRPRELRSLVRWQAGSMIAVGLVIGVPLGAALGGYGWREFAQSIGLVPTAAVPFGWLLVLVVALAGLALVSAAAPAWTAQRAARRAVPGDVAP